MNSVVMICTLDYFRYFKPLILSLFNLLKEGLVCL